MAEFDSSCFSAVAAFFGGEKGSTHGNGEVTQPSSQGTTSGRGRSGVGASSSRNQAEEGYVDETITKRLLQVGTKRKHNRDEDEGYEEHEQSESEDEDGGRTSIEEKGEAKPPDGLVSSTKKRKKKGKKERQLERATAKDTEASSDTSNSAEAQNDDKDTSNAEGTTKQDMKKKRKRPKIRSRQKNIYKDKRLPQHKPEHLIPGRPTFQGRPITPETRARLNLPPSKTSRKHLAHDKDRSDQGVDEGTSMELAVDTFLNNADAMIRESGGDEDIKPNSKGLKKKKQKKPKYKNLI